MSDAFIRAESQKGSKGLRVTYYRADGSSVTRVRGYRTWRNQNPGNITAAGNFARNHGSIGESGGFAVFPTYEAGRAASFSLLRTSKYQEGSISKAIEYWAPKEDGNNTERYKKLVHKWTGLDLKRKVKDLTEKELESLVDGIERMEGYRPGKIIEAPAPQNKNKISAVRKNKKGTIISYYVEELGWISKQKTIQLIAQGKIDAVIAHSRSGNPYVRTRPDCKVYNNFDALE